MRILVCGGREFADQDAVNRALNAVHRKRGITLIIEGGAAGADRLARNWAIANHIPYRTFEAHWATYGKRAGPLRNGQMLGEGKPDGVVAFPGGAGTADMLRQARAAGVTVWEPFATSSGC